MKKKQRDPYELKSIYEQMELELVASMQRNFAKHKQEEREAGFTWEMWQKAKLRDIQQYQKENWSIIYKAKKHIQEAINKVLRANFRKGQKNVEKASMPKSGQSTGNIGEKPPKEEHFFKTNQKKLDVMINSTKNDFEEVNQAIHRKMDDVYRQIVHNAKIQLTTGSISLDKAIDIASEDFLARGINSIAYKNKSGDIIRYVNIATYAEMALRTASQRATFLGEGSKRDEFGNHLVFVSTHINCCELCFPWQGQILIDDVFSHPSKEYIAKYKDKYKLLSEAIKAGLLHPNCRHTIATYFEGITKIPKIYDKVDASKAYRAEQKQRQLENKIRKAKRIKAGVVNEENKKEATSMLRKYQKELRDHIKAHPDLKRHSHREKIYESDNSNIKSNLVAYDKSSEVKKGIDKELMHDIKLGTRIMNKEFPMFKELIDKISYDHATTKEYAYSETGIENKKIVSSIKLGRWFTNKQNLVKGIQRDIDNKHTFKGATVTSLITHELTHALEVNLTLKDMEINPLNVTDEQWNTFRNRYGYISSQIKEKAMKNLGIEFMQPKWYKVYDDIGTYAKVNSNEFMAQCISQVLTTDSPSDIALEVYRLLKEMTK